MYSLIIPVYGNASTITDLTAALDAMKGELDGDLEVVFVVDGSPDDSYLRLRQQLPECRFKSVLISLSRNFGSFSAIRAGLAAATGPYFAVMAADLQEPPELVVEFFRALRAGTTDVAIGKRVSREGDPAVSRGMSSLYWSVYRRFVQPEMPPEGVDVFGCNEKVRSTILRLEETNSSLVGLLFWVGFRREYFPYARRKRPSGKSGWTFRKKLRYMSDSIFAFSDLPIRLMVATGLIGVLLSIFFSIVIVTAWATGHIKEPGYTPIMLAIFFFGTLFLLALGIVGSYVYRAFENTKGRPNYIQMSREQFDGSGR
jgi:polyisoprenyl-phosphate glycosyltransferase